ncbi:phosphoglycerate mutase (2,3-diphosphoglycerate-independent) [Rhodothalassium salexigens]|uniref:2,3-bisphosphoglycerate-independent phosphoglycerate mutase n=1 Tax=Rhodothalassium salexigens TaxID=1086 RepID=UPI0019141727|nr:2,3-bisphosphoglycerate-independent phosphoglycerate mutase [Rhodothalassium salexigens]MBK5911035.1 phosphoglycerate mutase (2,3-diphosphoglycerate-independent) [Rhodothalassium salexigens]MBK5920410.1 phosphoglycerate mutase (2,3-diphosphoglycerate-independent) [Rhodothalassium salexigens]
MSAPETRRPKPVVLCILDGWGWRPDSDANAAAQARTPVWDRLFEGAPKAFLKTSGSAVGLPEGQMGNSEVGHMNLGGGRVVKQDLPRIDDALGSGELDRNTAFRDFVTALKRTGGTAHLMGLVSPGGVHSHQRHIAALARALDTAGVAVRIHAFLDGRDTPPKSAAEAIARLETDLDGLDNARIATLSGRYFAMDRDKRWDRVEKAYRALVAAEGPSRPSPAVAVAQAYEAGETDEFVTPCVVAPYAGMADGDGVLMANFRADRAREILTALAAPAFDGFERQRTVAFAARAGMVEYSADLAPLYPALFPPEAVDNGFGAVVAKAGLSQLRIAETEKYAHVTFFFNGGEEDPEPGEERILVPSPKVATYDLAPEMSAAEVTDRVVDAIDQGRFDAIVINYANPDMVGHTGDMDAAKRACEAVDAGLGRLLDAVERAGGVAMVTADHGNVELMRDPETEQPHTAHTTLDVPVFLVNAAPGLGLENGRLADVAPTLLALMGLDQPDEMTGRVLLTGGDRAAASVAAE